MPYTIESKTITNITARERLVAETIMDSSSKKQYAVFAGGRNNGVSNVVDAFNITNGVASNPISGSLSGSRYKMATTTLIDVSTNIQYAIFAGGIDSNDDASNVIDAVSITGNAMNPIISNTLSDTGAYLAVTTIRAVDNSNI